MIQSAAVEIPSVGDLNAAMAGPAYGASYRVQAVVGQRRHWLTPNDSCSGEQLSPAFV
jgi:hypothetical protein